MFKLSDILKEDYKSSATRFVNQGYTKNVVSGYIDRFRELKRFNGSKLIKEYPGITIGVEQTRRNDIDSFKEFRDLEVFVDFMSGIVNEKKYVKTETEVSNSREIFNDKNITIYYADSQDACIEIKGDFNASWCVASRSSSMYYKYRFNDKSTFYFVKSKNKPVTDKYYFFVTEVRPKGMFFVTSASNGDTNDMTWADIVAIEPYLNGKEKYFKYVPIKKADREFFERYANDVATDDEYFEMTREEKAKYINIYGYEYGMSKEKFLATPQELQNTYIRLAPNGASSDETYAIIKANNRFFKSLISVINTNADLVYKFLRDHPEDCIYFSKETILRIDKYQLDSLLKMHKYEKSGVLINYLYPNLREQILSGDVLPDTIFNGLSEELKTLYIDTLTKNIDSGNIPIFKAMLMSMQFDNNEYLNTLIAPADSEIEWENNGSEIGIKLDEDDFFRLTDVDVNDWNSINMLANSGYNPDEDIEYVWHKMDNDNQQQIKELCEMLMIPVDDNKPEDMISGIEDATDVTFVYDFLDDSNSDFSNTIQRHYSEIVNKFPFEWSWSYSGGESIIDVPIKLLFNYCIRNNIVADTILDLCIKIINKADIDYDPYEYLYDIDVDYANSNIHLKDRLNSIVDKIFDGDFNGKLDVLKTVKHILETGYNADTSKFPVILKGTANTVTIFGIDYEGSTVDEPKLDVEVKAMKTISNHSRPRILKGKIWLANLSSYLYNKEIV